MKKVISVVVAVLLVGVIGSVAGAGVSSPSTPSGSKSSSLYVNSQVSSSSVGEKSEVDAEGKDTADVQVGVDTEAQAKAEEEQRAAEARAKVEEEQRAAEEAAAKAAAEAAAAEAAAAARANTTVYVTNTGDKYHTEGCRYLKSKNPITRGEAEARGYAPCGACGAARL